MQHKLLHPHHLFALFKYAVYLALLGNVWLFFGEDWSASTVLLGESDGLRRYIEVFAQTIDTFAWVVLLALFELETSIIPDSTLRERRVKWLLHGARGVCALIIVNSLIGYAGKFSGYLDSEVFHGDACALLQSGWFLLESIDEFAPLDAVNCVALPATGLFRLHGSNILAAGEVLHEARQLALLDAINAAAWILVVILLEADVRLQIRGALTGLLLKLSAALKLLTYAVLLFAAVWWGFVGEFLDFWDAFLWLVAFVFIELNIFQWQEESQRLVKAPVIKA